MLEREKKKRNETETGVFFVFFLFAFWGNPCGTNQPTKQPGVAHSYCGLCDLIFFFFSVRGARKASFGNNGTRSSRLCQGYVGTALPGINIAVRLSPAVT